MSLTVKQITDIATKQLEACGITDARRDSDELYCFMVGIPKSKMFTEYQYTLQEYLCDKYFELIDRRASGEPLQYIVGSTEFMGLPFKVEPGVLIPRQDTETLVEDALEVMVEGTLRKVPIGASGAANASKKKSWDVLDLCTGSGAIGISIAKIAPEVNLKVNVTMSDISKDALKIAKENARLNGVDKTVKILEGDLFAPFGGILGSKKFDLIICNPPYIPSDVIDTLQVEVRDHEPLLALDGGADGLDIYRQIAAGVGKHLKKDGILMMEIGHDQKDLVAGLLAEADIFADIRCHQDLAHHDRVIYAAR